MEPVLILTTVESREAADRIAEALVDRGLAACVQISSIDSVFRWEGAVQHEPEYRLLIKSVRERYTQVEETIVSLHAYEVPAILAVPVSEIHGPFAAWVVDNAGGG